MYKNKLIIDGVEYTSWVSDGVMTLLELEVMHNIISIFFL